MKLLLMLVRILLASTADSWTRGKPDQPSVWMKCPECGDRQEYKTEPVSEQTCYGPGPGNSQPHPGKKRERDYS